MAQLIRPGAPVLFGGAPATFHENRQLPDGRRGGASAGRAYVEVAKALSLPTQSYMALSDAAPRRPGGCGDIRERALAPSRA